MDREWLLVPQYGNPYEPYATGTVTGSVGMYRNATGTIIQLTASRDGRGAIVGLVTATYPLGDGGRGWWEQRIQELSEFREPSCLKAFEAGEQLLPCPRGRGVEAAMWHFAAFRALVRVIGADPQQFSYYRPIVRKVGDLPITLEECYWISKDPADQTSCRLRTAWKLIERVATACRGRGLERDLGKNRLAAHPYVLLAGGAHRDLLAVLERLGVASEEELGEVDGAVHDVRKIVFGG